MPRKAPHPSVRGNDPVYGSQLVTQLVNKVLLDGRITAERMFMVASNRPRDQTGTDPVVTLKRASTTSSRHSRCAAARRWRDLPVPVEFRAERS